MRKRLHALPVSMVVIIAGLLALQGCGRGSVLAPAAFTRSTEGFVISAIPDPLLQDKSAGELRLEPLLLASSGDAVTVRVSVKRARSFKAAYFRLDYDPARYTPLAAIAGPALRDLAEQGQLLELSVFSQPGSVYCGQCLPRWDKAEGFNGDGLVASIRFSQRPFTAIRAVSAPPDSPPPKTARSL